MKKVNFKYLIILVLIFIGSFLAREYKMLLLDNIKIAITSKYFFLFITFAAFPIKLLYKIKFNELNFKDFLDPKKIKDSISEIVSAIAEPSTFVCSFSILKGLYLDFFYADNYFAKFNDAEKSFLLFASFYFFIVTFNELKNYTIELLTDSNDTEQPEP